MDKAVHQLGWKSFFGLLTLLQVVALSVIWRTYDAVQDTGRLAVIHDYQIREEIRPAIKQLQDYQLYQGRADRAPADPAVPKRAPGPAPQ